MPKQNLNLDDVRLLNSAERIADTFQRLGYTKVGERLRVEDLDLSARNSEAVYDAHLIADQGEGGLQVVLLELHDSEWESPSMASTRMKSIATQIGKRPSEFLLLATTKKYDQLMLVNPRKTFDDQTNLKVSIRKLLIDRKNPTAYDRDRLESLAVNGQDPQTLYKTHCEEFDVEKLTKKFYEGYKKLFERVQQAVKGHNPDPYFEDPDRLHQFSQRLLGRIMFLYFLQKKEFLAGDRRFLDNQYRKHQYGQDDCDYYTEILEPLFFDTLNKQRPNFDSQWGKIPYLNGGLFDRDYGPDIRDTAGKPTPETITLPNALFNPGNTESILNYFNGYNFTVSENVAGDEDIAVDPEMLGKVFENMLAAEERGKSGTFYTPRGIVQFMCSEVLARYLADETGMTLEATQQLIDYDPDVTDAGIKELISPQQVKSLQRAIEDIKVLDPAVGSGAFPLGMMQIILNVRQAVARREGMTVQRGSLAISQWKRDIIANNLYGVDIKPEAIEIAKLRMWLSLVVDIPRIEDVEPLPNLDYKLMCGDSLISTIHGEQLIPDPNKDKLQLEINVTPIQKAIQPLLDLQHRYFDAQSEERQELRKQILDAEANVFRVAVGDRRNYWLGKQRELEQQIRLMKGQVSKAQEKERAEITTKLEELEKFSQEVESGDRSLNFFQYHLHFRDVFNKKGGFDCVIGNPPYVRQEQIKDIKPALQAEYECYTGVADLYVYFYEKGLKLLKSEGYLAYITSNKWFKANYGINLRKYLVVNCKIHSITDFGELPVFDAATFPMIFICQNRKEKEQFVLFTQVTSLEIPYPNIYALIKEEGRVLGSGTIQEDKWSLSSNDLKKINIYTQNNSTLIPLKKYIKNNIYRGITTGFNEAFIINRDTKNNLIKQDQGSQEIIKPFLGGKNIRKWRIDSLERWLIFTRRGILIENYPAIKNYLLQYKEHLSPKTNNNQKIGRKPGDYKWYEIQDVTTYYMEFEKPKIIFPDIAKESRFTFDINNFFLGNTAYIIPTSDFYLLGVLNSFLIWNHAKANFSCLGDPNKGGRFRFISQSVVNIPIPIASKSERQVIASLVQKCLDAKGVGVEEWEAEIDDRVAHLYGLTAEDMKIIRGE